MNQKNINLLIEDYISQLHYITQNCGLPITIVYLALQNLTNEIEKQYIATINTLALHPENEESHILDLKAETNEKEDNEED